MKKILLFALVAGLTTLTACKKEGCTDPLAENYDTKAKKDDGSCTYEEVTPQTQDVTIHMDNKWNGSEFSLNTALTHPTTSDELTFTTFKYYVSNIQLKKADGTWYVQPESYYLVDASQGEMFVVPNVPAGTYTEMKYTMGVDSTRNVSGAQTGALSTANGMFWSWNSGYIMAKAEGTSPQSGTGSFTYHLGGFMGSNNTVEEKTVVFGGNLNVGSGGSPKVHLGVDVSSMWTTLGSVSGVNAIHMPGANAVTMLGDFHDGITFMMIHN